MNANQGILFRKGPNSEGVPKTEELARSLERIGLSGGRGEERIHGKDLFKP
jgi:hypothetical protein